MSETFKLEATQRHIVGKHVKQYRRQGQIPAVVYGPEFEPVKLFIGEAELRQVLTHAAGTHLIELNVDGTPITTLAREVQRHPIKGNLLHVDFYRVAMDRLIRAEIPIVIVGTSPAVARREAIVLQSTTTLQIEVLPAELPAHIEVDVSALNKVGDLVMVSDLELPSSVRVMTSMDELVLKLDYAESVMPEGEEEAAPSAAEPEVLTAKKEEDEGSEG